jgi:hypothetical protein
MLAKKLSNSDSERPTRPSHPRPIAAFESVPPLRTQLMLVPTPSATPRSLAWARRQNARAFNGPGLAAMLRMERLNLG